MHHPLALSDVHATREGLTTAVSPTGHPTEARPDAATWSPRGRWMPSSSTSATSCSQRSWLPTWPARVVGIVGAAAVVAAVMVIFSSLLERGPRRAGQLLPALSSKLG
jgi:hypothetical protein